MIYLYAQKRQFPVLRMCFPFTPSNIMPSVSIPGRVLVTGASGFLASHISRTLLSRGHVVVGTGELQSLGSALLVC